MRRTLLRSVSALLVVGGALGPRSLPAQQPVDTADKSIDLGGQSTYQGDADRFPLQITGFGIGNYSYAGRTGDNSFSASKIAVGAFREITQHAYVFGQLTTALHAGEAGAEPTTETEIDALLVSLVVPGASDLSLTFGKFDAPIGFERDDEPLNFLATTSFNFELARPAKMVGLQGTWTASPALALTALVFNGWDSDIDPNQGKTGGLRLDLLPSEAVSLGVAGLYGVEGQKGATNPRYLLTVDYAFQPTWNWVIAGEASLGGDKDALPNGGNATWKGGMITAYHQLGRHWGLAARAEILKDDDGTRTGTAQTLESYSIAPLFSLGTGRDGIFANVSRTKVRIPRLQLRGEVRVNHSGQPFFAASSGPDTWNIEYRLQLVTTF
jgi:putative OmpL-like beta-barrel porin-2